MAAALEGPVHLATPIELIQVMDDGRVRIALPGGRRVEHDALVVAVPLPALRRIRIEADLPAGFQAMLAEGRLGRNEKVVGGFAGRPWIAEGRFSDTVWTDLGFASAWDATARQGGASAAGLTFFHGGREVDALPRRADAAFDRALGLLDEALPGLKQAALPGCVRTDWAGEGETGGGYTSFAPGAYSRFAEFLWYEDETGASGPAFGRLTFAGEHLSDAFYGYMNGASETGRLAARHLVALG